MAKRFGFGLGFNLARRFLASNFWNDSFFWNDSNNWQD